MSAISWFVSPASSSFWEATSIIVGAVVAVSVLGESISHLIPPRFLPTSLQGDETLKGIAWWSTVFLIVALALEVPINMAKDSANQQQISNLATNLKNEHDSHLPRSLSVAQQDSIASAMKAFARNKDGSPQRVAVFAISNGFEGAHLADDIAAALGPGQAGWGINRYPVTMSVPLSVLGVGMFTSASQRGALVATALAKALNDVGVAAFVIPQKWNGCEDTKLVKDPENDPFCTSFSVEIGDHP